MAQFDFNAAIAAANAVVEKAQQKESGTGGNYQYPLLYPPQGSTVVVRPLFNPASGQILRLVNRHEKTACYRTYGQECPICKVMQQVKDMSGQDPFGRTKASRSRGVCFAQFISSTTPISKGDNKGNLQPGEIILFMFPWSVYQQINAVIQAAAQTPTGMEMAFSHSQQGLYLQITVSNDFKYQTTNVPYMTFPSQMNDDQFMEMLEGMPSLNEQVLPSTITEDVQKQVTEYADAIYRQFIAPHLAQQPGVAAGTPVGFNAPPQQPAPGYVPPVMDPNQIPNQGYPTANYPQSGPQTSYPPQNYQTTPPQGYTPPQYQQPAPPYVPPTNPMTAPPANTGGTVTTSAAPSNGKPACYGHHQDNNTQCICCPCEVECMQKPF